MKLPLFMNILNFVLLVSGIISNIFGLFTLTAVLWAWPAGVYVVVSFNEIFNVWKEKK